MSLRRNLAPGFLRQAQKPECAGIMPALRSLYHVRGRSLTDIVPDFSAAHAGIMSSISIAYVSVKNNSFCKKFIQFKKEK